MSVTFNRAKPVEAFTSDITSFYTKDFKVTVPPLSAAPGQLVPPPAVDAAYQQQVTDKTTAFKTSLATVKQSYENKIKDIIQNSQSASTRLGETEAFKFAIDPRKIPGLPDRSDSNYFIKMREKQDEYITQVLNELKNQFNVELAKIKVLQEEEKREFERTFNTLNQSLSTLSAPATPGSPTLSTEEKNKQLKTIRDEFNAHQKNQRETLKKMFEERQVAFLNRSDNAGIDTDLLVKIGLGKTREENRKAAGDILLESSMTGSNENEKLIFHESVSEQYYDTKPQEEISKPYNTYLLKNQKHSRVPGTFHMKESISQEALNALIKNTLHDGARFSIGLEKDPKNQGQKTVTVTFDNSKTLSFTDRMNAWSVAIHKLAQENCTKFDITKTTETFILPDRDDPHYETKLRQLVKELFYMNPESPLFANPSQKTPKDHKDFTSKEQAAFELLDNDLTGKLFQQEARAALAKRIYLHCPNAMITFGYLDEKETARLEQLSSEDVQKEYRTKVEQKQGFSGIGRGIGPTSFDLRDENQLDIEVGRGNPDGNQNLNIQVETGNAPVMRP